MDENKVKRSSQTSPNISQISTISTIQTTVDVKIFNIKEINTKTSSINQSTQSINNSFSPNISKKKLLQKM